MSPIGVGELVATHSTVHFGLPQVDWRAVNAALGNDASTVATRRALVAAWLDHLAHAVPGAERIDGANFVCLSLPRCAVGAPLLAFAQDARWRILEKLPGIAMPRDTILPILLFPRFDDYVSYEAGLEATGDDGDAPGSAREVATSGGMFVASGCPHVVMPVLEAWQYEPTLAHELTHAHVSHLSLPLWLNEGFAESMQVSIVGDHSPITADSVREHREYWSDRTIQGFWSGEGFRCPEGQRLCYELARVLVGMLAKGHASLRELALTARPEDAGEAAFRAVFGRSLATLPEALLGRGPWGPQPDRW